MGKGRSFSGQRQYGACCAQHKSRTAAGTCTTVGGRAGGRAGGQAGAGGDNLCRENSAAAFSNPSS